MVTHPVTKTTLLLNPHQADISESLIRREGGTYLPHKWNWLYWLYFLIHCNKNGTKGLWGDKDRPSLGPGPALVLQWTLPWPYSTPNMALYILAIFLHSTQQKWDQGTLGTQRSTLIGCRTRLGPSMDPAMALQYTWHGPLYIGYIFAFYATKMGSRDSGDTKVNPHWF